MAGLKVNAAGLEFINYKVEPSFKGGRFVVSVNAEVKNLRDEDTPVPPVRAKILDAENRTVSTILVPSNGLVVAPHETRTLVFDVPDANNMASSVELMFDLVALKAGEKAGSKKSANHAADAAKDHAPSHAPSHVPEAADHGQDAAHAAPADSGHDSLKPAAPHAGEPAAPPALKSTPHH